MAVTPQIGASQDAAVPDFVPGFCNPMRRRMLLIAAILASAMGFIDGSVVAIAIPAMRETLGASLTEAQWINNAYMLTLSALILAGGAAGDKFGLARIFSIGVGVFLAASVACALAPRTDVLIWARALQGIGAALMVPGSLALIARAYPEAERGRAIGIWAAAASLTTALGPILGGALLSFGGPDMWRAIFALNLPIGLATLWLIRRAVTSDPGKPDQRLDVPGALLATLGLGLLAWSLSHEGGADQSLGLAAVGVLILGVFLWIEGRTAAPMMDLRLFAKRNFSAANALTFCLYFALSAVLFFLPMTLISTWGLSELVTTLAFAPLSVFIPLLSTMAGKLADRHGAAIPIASGSALVAIAYAGLGLTAPMQNFWGHVMPLMCVMGVGMALVVAPLSTAVMSGIAADRTGAASGVNNAVSRIAGLVAVAAMGRVAALAYDTAGGPSSFGAAAEAASHLSATNSAFATIAFTTAVLAAISAGVAWTGLERKRPAPAA